MKKLLYGLCLLFITSCVHSGIIVIESYDGMHTDESALLISDTQSPDMSNCDPSSDGLSLQRRDGQSFLFDITYTTYSVKSIGFLKNSSYDVALIGYGNIIESVDRAYTKTVIHSTATVGYTWDFVQHQETVYATNGKDDVFSFDGASTTSIPSAPTGTSIAIYNDTFFISNYPNNKARIQYSAYSSPTDWTTGTGPTEGRSFDVADYGDQVVDLEVNGGVLGILCSNSLLKLSGTQNPYQVIEVDKSIGCKSKGSVTTYRGLTYFLGTDGQYYATNFVTVDSISEDEFFTAFDNSGLAQKVSSFQIKSSQVEWGAGISSHTSTTILVDSVVLSTGTTIYTTALDWNAFTLTNVDSTTILGSITLLASSSTIVTTSPNFNSVLSATNFLGQTITLPINTSANILSVDVTMADGSPTSDTITLSIYTDSGSDSPDTLLGQQTFPAINLSATTKVISFTFDESIPILESIVYWIVLSKTDSNQVLVRGSSSNSHDGGKAFLSLDGGSSWSVSSPVIERIVGVYTDMYISSGIAISPIIDTTFNNPIYGTLVTNWTIPTGTEIVQFLRTSTLSDLSDNPNWVEIPNTGVLSTLDAKRYIQYKSSLTTTISNVTPTQNDTTLIWSTTGYYITDAFTTIDINTWGLFEVDEALNEGTIDYSCFSTNTIVQDYDLTISSMVTWIDQTKDAIISVATNTYIYVKSTFTITSGTQTPAINAITLNWNSGSNSTEDMTARWFNNRLYVGVLASGSSSKNDAVFVYDPDIGEGAWWKYLSGVNPSVFADWDGKFLIASSTGASVSEFLTGDKDFGMDIDAYYYTKKLFAPTLYQPDSYDTLSVAFDAQDSGNLLIDYYLNGASASENQYILDMTDGTDIIFKNFKFPRATNAYYIQFKISNQLGSYFNFYTLQAITADLPFRIQMQ